MEKDKKERRSRRTNIVLEKDIMEAAKSVIEEEGFAKTTLSAIIQKANIEPNVFYKRFENLEDLFEQFTRKYDYWISDIMDMQSEKDDYMEYSYNLMAGVVESLYDNKSMQQILIWDISADNPITRESAMARETASQKLIDKYNDIFKNSGFNFDVFSALVIGGIYYLVLRRHRGSFCGVDFSTVEGREKLLNTIKSLIIKIYNSLEEDMKVAKIVFNMKKEGLDNQTIAKYTGLTADEISRIAK